MAVSQKLELTWIGKDQRPRLEPRILREDTERSYHAKQRATDNDLFDNQLIKGDNLLALKRWRRSLRARSNAYSLTHRTTRAACLLIMAMDWSYAFISSTDLKSALSKTITQ